MSFQQHKVEICGVDTGSLPVLTEEQKNHLLRVMQSGTPDEQEAAREKMISGNLRLVLSVVRRFSGRGESVDDLFQVGCIGLMKAVDHFDPEKDVRFSTYGVPMIIGEIRRYLRDNSTIRVSRSLKDIAYRALQAREKLITERGREPGIEEIAEEIAVPPEQVVIALEATYEPLSIYEPVYSDGADTVYLMDTLGDDSSDDSWLEQIALKDAVGSLGEREKRILKLRYGAGKTQTEVAAEIGISQAQVSRLEKSALSRIRAHSS